MKRFAILLAIVSTTTAHAEDKKAAQRYFAAGAKAYASQNFAAAIENFEEAYRAMPIPEIAFSGAQAYRRQYRVDAKPQYVKRSVELYKAYLDKVKSGGRVGDAADSLGEMQRELDRLTASGAKIESARVVERTRLGVSIGDGTPEGVALREVGDAVGDATKGITATLDGKPLEPFALVDVEPGDHVIEVIAEGYEKVTEKRRAVPGASDLVDIKLVAKPAMLTVKTEDATHVVVDGRSRGTMPMGTLDLVAGKHVIAFLRSGREPVARELVVTRGQALSLDVPLQKTARRRAVPWVLAGAGVVALGAVATGIVAVVADGDASDLHDAIATGDRPASDADQYDRDVKRRDDAVTATWVLGGAAVVATAVGLGLYLFDSPSAEGVTVTPVATGTSAAAMITGRW